MTPTANITTADGRPYYPTETVTSVRTRPPAATAPPPTQTHVPVLTRLTNGGVSVVASSQPRTWKNDTAASLPDELQRISGRRERLLGTHYTRPSLLYD